MSYCALIDLKCPLKGLWEALFDLNFDGVVYDYAMDALTAFGLFAVSGMLVCYAFDGRSHWWGLGFSVFCLLGSAYGFLQGAWPFGLVECVWAIVAARRWWVRRS
jgi:hypothetical protein